MKEHELTHEEVRRMFDYDPSGVLIRRIAPRGSVVGEVAGTTLTNGYVQICVHYKKYLAHRLVWLWHHATLPKELDHIDRDRANNRIENLRAASKSQNSGNRNKSVHKSSLWRGVHWSNTVQRWIAALQPSGKNIRIGSFKCEADAALAYNFAAAAYFGEFTNFNSAEQTGLT